MSWMETRFPCPSRVVWNRSLVRPIILLPSFRSTEDDVAEASCDRADDFAISVSNVVLLRHDLPPVEVYGEGGKNGQFWRVI